jgi:hypothetical protein
MSIDNWIEKLSEFHDCNIRFFFSVKFIVLPNMFDQKNPAFPIHMNKMQLSREGLYNDYSHTLLAQLFLEQIYGLIVKFLQN